MWNKVTEKLPKTNSKFNESDELLLYDDKTYNSTTGWYNSETKEWKIGHFKATNEPIRVSHWKVFKRPVE